MLDQASTQTNNDRELDVEDLDAVAGGIIVVCAKPKAPAMADGSV